MKPQNPASELRAEIWQLRPFFNRAIIFSLIASTLSLAPTIYMLEVYDRVVNSGNMNTLLMLTLLVVGIYVVMELLEWVRVEIMQHAGQRLDERMSERVFNAIFAVNLRRAQGGTQQALTDLRTLRDFLSTPVVLAVMESPVAVFFLVLLFLISPTLGWFAVLGALIQLALAALTERRTQPPLAEANKMSIAAQNYANGTLRNAQVIESMGMLRGIHARWMERQHKFLNLQATASDHAGGLTAASKSVQLVQSSAMLGLGCWLMLQGDLAGGGGMMLVGSILGGKILQPLVQVVSNWKMVINARDAFQRLDSLLQEIPQPTPGMSLPPPKGNLSVEAVSAGAPGSPAFILRNVTFQLPAGECLAVVGPSASGKTTLARLLTGLWPAQSGKVRLDGADVFSWNKAELGPYVGYLPQGVELFDGTLAENIARFGDVDPVQVEAAARLVGLDALAAELPNGYDSPIGDEGAFLSGGQRQRVGLARAIYGSPRFVVLDEPNSSLDEAGEAALLQTLRMLKSQGVTVILITHRTSVLVAVDRMLILRDGMVQAYGPRDEVLAALNKAREAQQPPQGRPALTAAVGGVQ